MTHTTDRRHLAVLAMSGMAATLGAPGVALAHDSGAKDYSAHPFCGSWMTMALPSYQGGPPVPAVSVNWPNGSAFYSFPVSQRSDDGVTFVSGHAGVWEPYDDWTGHITNIQFVSDSAGDIINIIAIDGYPRVSEDGMSFSDDFKLSRVTIYNLDGDVLMEIPPGTDAPPITGRRMSPGVFGFPVPGTPEASPTS